MFVIQDCLSPKVITSSKDCQHETFAAKNVEYDYCETHATYWLAPDGSRNSSFTVDMGCEVKLAQISLKNTRGGDGNDR